MSEVEIFFRSHWSTILTHGLTEWRMDTWLALQLLPFYQIETIKQCIAWFSPRMELTKFGLKPQHALCLKWANCLLGWSSCISTSLIHNPWSCTRWLTDWLMDPWLSLMGFYPLWSSYFNVYQLLSTLYSFISIFQSLSTFTFFLFNFGIIGFIIIIAFFCIISIAMDKITECIILLKIKFW